LNGGKLLEDVTDAMATNIRYVGGKGSLWISNLGITGLISHVVVDAKDKKKLRDFMFLW
jgi:hypothetical protein